MPKQRTKFREENERSPQETRLSQTGSALVCSNFPSPSSAACLDSDTPSVLTMMIPFCTELIATGASASRENLKVSFWWGWFALPVKQRNGVLD